MSPMQIRQALSRREGQRGFTMVELLIVSAMIGVLAAISIPAYRGYIRRAKTSSAQNCLVKSMTAQERHRADNGTYASAIGDLAAYQVEADCAIENSAKGETYTLSVNSGASATAFTMTATADIGGSQKDIWTIDQNGKLAHTQDGT